MKAVLLSALVAGMASAAEWRPDVDNALNHNADWNDVLTSINPNAWANMGIAFGLGFSIVGAAWGIFACGSSILGAAIKAPRIRSKNLIRSVTKKTRHTLSQRALNSFCFGSQCHFLRGDCHLRRYHCDHSVVQGGSPCLSCRAGADPIISVVWLRRWRWRSSLRDHGSVRIMK